jgi:NitT/TauT family transport system substrate-binding protein
MVGGDFEVGALPWTGFLVALNSGIPLYPLSEADRGAKGATVFMVKSDSAIKTVDDFVGKKIGAVSVGSYCDLIPNDLLRRKGLDYKSIRYTVMGIPDMPAIVMRDGADAACIPEPILTIARDQGGLRPAFDLFSGEYEGIPVVGFQVMRKFFETYPNTFAALQRAMNKGLAFVHNNPDKLREIFPTFMAIKPELARTIVLNHTPEKSDFTQLQKVADLMDRMQVLPAKTRLPDLGPR